MPIMLLGIEKWIFRVAPPLAASLGLASLWAVFFHVPTDATLGISQRIFYWHVPSAIACYLAFGIAGISSAVFLKTRSVDWDHAAHAGVSIGLAFATIVLGTGCIWAHTAWGTWWTWDSRLTTFLLLWLVYASYLLLRMFAHDNPMAPRFAAVLALVGTTNVPLVVMATRIFRTIHPQVIGNPKGGIDDPRMVAALLLGMGAFLALVLWMWALDFSGRRLAAHVDLLQADLDADAPGA